MIERINLIPDEILIDKKARQKRPFVISIVVLYFLCLGAVYIYQDANIKKVLNIVERTKMQKDELIAQNTRYREVIDRINLVQKREEDIRKRLAVISSLLEDRVYWSKILRNTTHRIPNEIWLTSLSTNDAGKGSGKSSADSTGGKGIRFNGTALSNSAIASFVFALENSSDFKSVLLVYSQKNESQDRDLYDFEISADIREAKR